MIFKKVLVPYDESDHALSALHAALGMVGDDPEAEVHVLTVVSIGAMPTPSFEDPLAANSQLDYDHIMGAMLHRVRSDIDKVVEGARDDTSCRIVSNAIISTSPVEGIVEYVESRGMDLVVMGRRGLGALRGMLGSVSFGVLRSVEVPVLTVK